MKAKKLKRGESRKLILGALPASVDELVLKTKLTRGNIYTTVSALKAEGALRAERRDGKLTYHSTSFAGGRNPTEGGGSRAA